MRRVVIAAIAGGIVMFLWGWLAHVVLPIGGMGLQSLPNEEEIRGVLSRSIPEAGLYFFPGIDLGGGLTPEEQAAWQDKYRSGSTGLLVYHPVGGEHLSPRKLVTEFASNVLGAGVAALLVAWMAASYGRRVLAVTLLGLFGWLSISASYWNWYGFPGEFFAAEGLEQVVGWFLAGLPIAGIARRTIGPAS